MAQTSDAAVSGVQPVRSSSASATDSAEQGLPSQRSFDLAANLASAFNRPDSSIPQIAQAVDGLLNATSAGATRQAFQDLARALGIELGSESKPEQAAPSSAASGADDAGGGAEDDLEKLIKMLIKMFGVDFVKNLLKSMGKSDGEIQALLGKLGVADSGDSKGSTGMDWSSLGGAQFNRG